MRQFGFHTFKKWTAWEEFYFREVGGEGLFHGDSCHPHFGNGVSGKSLLEGRECRWRNFYRKKVTFGRGKNEAFGIRPADAIGHFEGDLVWFERVVVG